MARLPNKNLEICAQVLDAGCDGIIVPNIKNKKELIKIRNNIYFPPAGQRGVDSQELICMEKILNKP